MQASTLLFFSTVAQFLNINDVVVNKCCNDVCVRRTSLTAVFASLVEVTLPKKEEF